MLVRFAVGNFMSFKEVTEFKMAAGKVQKHRGHVATLNDKRVLKGAFAFGANASGKSNLINAMEFVQNMVFEGVNAGDCINKHFRIDSSYKDKVGVFQFDIFEDGHFYSYGLAISYRTAEVEEEWLYLIDDEDVRIFERGRDESGKMVVVCGEENTLVESDKKRFEVLAEAFEKGNMGGHTFLQRMEEMSSRESEYYMHFHRVLDWFGKLQIIYPDSIYGNIAGLLSDKIIRQFFESHLKHLDTGVVSIEQIEKDFDSLFSNQPKDVVEKLKENIRKRLKNNEGFSQVVDGSHHTIALKDGDIKAVETLFNHGNSDDLFKYTDESDGTQRLLNLLPMYRSIFFDRVFVVDEIDRSLHTKATLEFIRLFYDAKEGQNSQLIATTHDTNILDLDLLRQDEIWLVEKTDEGESTLKPLSAYKPRFDKDVKKDYLIGRYGAVPIFDSLALLEDEDGEVSV